MVSKYQRYIKWWNILGFTFNSSITATKLLFSKCAESFTRSFNNVLSVTGYCSKETPVCCIIIWSKLSVCLYGCEVCHLADRNLYRICLDWNNCITRIFKCRWMHFYKLLQNCHNTLPLFYNLIDETLWFRCLVHYSDNSVLLTSSYL